LSASTTAATKFTSFTKKSLSLLREDCQNDYLVPDFTLSQVKTLRRVQAVPTRNQAANSLYRVLTLDELLRNVQTLKAHHSSIAGKTVGLAIEIYEAEWY